MKRIRWGRVLVWILVPALGLLWPNPALAQGFVLCPDSAAPCARADYFVGFERSQPGAAAWPDAGLRLYPGVADIAARLPEAERAIGPAEAEQRIDSLRVGAAQKSQTLRLPGTAEGPDKLGADKLGADKLETTTDLLWGDTFEISSKRLSAGDPVALRIGREVMNRAAAETEFASDRLTLQTWVNGHLLPKLDYQLAKYPGPGETVREQGKRQTSVSVLVNVGESVRLESRLRMRAGLSASGSAQAFEGSHGVSYQVDLLSDDSCARSQSGLLTTGDCD